MIEWYLAHILLTSVALLAIPNFFIFPCMLGKKFDRIMKQQGLSVPKGFGIIPAHIVRTGLYALNIVIFPNPKKYPKLMRYYRQRFGDFWFRAHASTWDKIQAWYITSLTVIIIISLLLITINSGIQYLIKVF